MMAGCIMMRSVPPWATRPGQCGHQNPYSGSGLPGSEFVESFFTLSSPKSGIFGAVEELHCEGRLFSALDTRHAHWKAHKLDHGAGAPQRSRPSDQDLYCGSRQDHGLDKGARSSG